MPKKIKEDLPAQAGKNNVGEDSAVAEKELEERTETITGGIFDQEGELVVDVFETNEDFVVTAAIAGIQIKDLDISLEKDMMVIKGNRCDPHTHTERKYFYQECYWGPFSRKIILPENIDIDAADAQMDHGVLTIKIPKNESNGKSKVGIKTA